MADSLLRQDLIEHDEVRALAEDIRRTQNAEIRQMQRWLETLFAQTPADTEHGGHYADVERSVLWNTRTKRTRKEYRSTA